MLKVTTSACIAVLLTACSNMPWTGDTTGASSGTTGSTAGSSSTGVGSSSSRSNTTDATTSRSSSAFDPSIMGGARGGPRSSGTNIHTPY